jgi:hypothetical protein
MGDNNAYHMGSKSTSEISFPEMSLGLVYKYFISLEYQISIDN